jgi:hypothetical protein
MTDPTTSSGPGKGDPLGRPSKVWGKVEGWFENMQ